MLGIFLGKDTHTHVYVRNVLNGAFYSGMLLNYGHVLEKVDQIIASSHTRAESITLAFVPFAKSEWAHVS